MKKSDIAHNRRTRVLHIIKTQFKGNKTKFSHALSENSGKHIAVTIVHRWFWDNHQRRNIGESHARLIESAFGLEYAWLDGFTNATLQSEEQINEPRIEYLIKKTKPATVAPVLTWEQLGQKKRLDDADITEWIAKPTGSTESYFLRVGSEAMLSQEAITFAQGALILVDPQNDAAVNDFVIAQVKGQKTPVFRQLKQEESKTPYLKPLNSSFPIISEQFEIIGKVVYYGAFLS